MRRKADASPAGAIGGRGSCHPFGFDRPGVMDAREPASVPLTSRCPLPLTHPTEKLMTTRKAFAAGKVFVLLLAVAVWPAMADTFQPDHNCRKPVKPYQFTSQWEIDSFRNDVEEYKRCITEFVEEQQDSIRKHSQAADNAIEDWNSFVNSELN